MMNREYTRDNMTLYLLVNTKYPARYIESLNDAQLRHIYDIHKQHEEEEQKRLEEGYFAENKTEKK